MVPATSHEGGDWTLQFGQELAVRHRGSILDRVS